MKISRRCPVWRHPSRAPRAAVHLFIAMLRAEVERDHRAQRILRVRRGRVRPSEGGALMPALSLSETNSGRIDDAIHAPGSAPNPSRDPSQARHCDCKGTTMAQRDFSGAVTNIDQIAVREKLQRTPSQYDDITSIHRQILVPQGIPKNEVRPTRIERRARLFSAIARGRRWLDEIVSGSVAARQKCSARQVNVTISLAFLASDLVRAAVEGRLSPHPFPALEQPINETG
jgi:hypothetical protein